MSNDIVASILAKDFSASGPNAIAQAPAYSNLTVTAGAVGYIEWKVVLPSAGKYRLHALMTAADTRPCTLSINGVKQASPILGENTGSWQSDKLQWFVYGPYDFKQGENIFRIDFTSYQPHLKEFGFSHADAVPLIAWEFPWRPLAKSGSVIGIAALRNGTLLGVGTDHQLYTTQLRQAPGESLGFGQWALIPGSGAVMAVTQRYDGSLLGVGMDNALWTRPGLAGAWTQVPNSKAVKSVVQCHDGTLLGVGMDNALWIRASLASAWVQVPNSGSVTSVTQLADGRIVGIGTDKRPYTRATLADAWTPLADGTAMAALTQLADGTLLGAGADTLLHFVPVASALPSANELPVAKAAAKPVAAETPAPPPAAAMQEPVAAETPAPQPAAADAKPAAEETPAPPPAAVDAKPVAKEPATPQPAAATPEPVAAETPATAEPSQPAHETSGAASSALAVTLPQASPAQDTLPPAEAIAHIVKLVGEAQILPGFSLLMDGAVLEGSAHAALGLAAVRLLGATAGPVGWLLLAANSYSKSVSGKHLHQHVEELF